MLVRKVVAGLIIGCGAAAIVLGLDALFSTFQPGTGENLLQAIELKTYDWRPELDSFKKGIA